MKSNTRYLVALHLGAIAILLLSTALPTATGERRAQEGATAVRELIEGNQRYVAGTIHPIAAGLSATDLASGVRCVAVSVAPPDGSPGPAAIFDLPDNRLHTFVVGRDPAERQTVVAGVERVLAMDAPRLIVVVQYGTGATADLSDGMLRAIEGSPSIGSAIRQSTVRLAVAVVDPETWRASVR